MGPSPPPCGSCHVERRAGPGNTLRAAASRAMAGTSAALDASFYEPEQPAASRDASSSAGRRSVMILAGAASMRKSRPADKARHAVSERTALRKERPWAQIVIIRLYD